MSRRRPTRLGCLTAVAALTACGLFAAGASASHRVSDCDFVRASVPYTHRGQRDRWRVYKTGAAPCPQAVRVLKAVMHLNGSQHVGTSQNTSYITYGAWRCDFGQMGEEFCWTPAHLPYRARALALDCAVSCPAVLTRDYGL
jgi:hypothetical protein